MGIWRQAKDDEEVIVVGECDCGARVERCVCNTKIVKKEQK